MYRTIRDGAVVAVYRRTLDQEPRLDIRAWIRDGMLASNMPVAVVDDITFVDVASSADRRQSVRVGVRISGDLVELSYADRSGLRPDLPIIRTTTPFVFTATRFGGRRRWLACPGCDRPCCVLYFAALRFVCARCARCCLPYASQCETPAARMHRRADKGRRKLNAPLDVPSAAIRRPRYFRRSAFDRIRWRIGHDERQARLLTYQAALGRFNWFKAL